MQRLTRRELKQLTQVQLEAYLLEAYREYVASFQEHVLFEAAAVYDNYMEKRLGWMKVNRANMALEEAEAEWFARGEDGELE